MNRLTDHFERVTVVSLPSRADRRERVSRHLRELELVPEVEWTDAVTGDPSSMPPTWSAGAGAWGCLQSHLQALRGALTDRVASILILEDDVVFSPHTSRCLAPLMAALPADWGQFYLGGQHIIDPSRTASPLIWRAGNINRAHAWAASVRHLPRIVEHLSSMEDYTPPPGHSGGWHLDHQLGRAHERALWPCYTPSWWFAGQEADTSDICGQLLQRRWWHHRRYALSLPFVCLSGSDAAAGDPRFLTGPEDETFARALSRDALLASWLHTRAEVALDYGCLPAWSSPRLSAERVADLWPSGILLNPEEGIEDYPFNRLFSHAVAGTLAGNCQ